MKYSCPAVGIDSNRSTSTTNHNNRVGYFSKDPMELEYLGKIQDNYDDELNNGFYNINDDKSYNDGAFQTLLNNYDKDYCCRF